MSRLLYQAELHRRVTARPGLTTGPVVDRTSPFTESNRRPSPYHGDALPTELKGHCSGAGKRLYLGPFRVRARGGDRGWSRPADRATGRTLTVTCGRRAGGAGRRARRCAPRCGPAANSPGGPPATGG